MVVIACRDLAKTYGSGAGAYPALRGVTFSIERGELVAVTGPSGCGKSTLMHLVGLLDKPSSGSLTVLERASESLDDDARTALRRHSIGFVFQAFHLLLRHTALDNVCLPMSYAGVPRAEREARALQLLERVGLGKKAGKTPLELSGGERQRVGIARALANKPALLLADEPTGNLDSKASAGVMSLLRELSAEGMTVVLVTHDPNIASTAPRLLRLRDGKIES